MLKEYSELEKYTIYWNKEWREWRIKWILSHRGIEASFDVSISFIDIDRQNKSIGNIIDGLCAQAELHVLDEIQKIIRNQES